MKAIEQLLVEEYDTMLQQDSQLGLSIHDELTEPLSRDYANEKFALKITDLTHHDGICAALKKVHDFKYIQQSDDQNPVSQDFIATFTDEMNSMGIPKDEQDKAINKLKSLANEIDIDGANEDNGFNDNLDEIIKVSKPSQIK